MIGGLVIFLNPWKSMQAMLKKTLTLSEINEDKTMLKDYKPKKFLALLMINIPSTKVKVIKNYRLNNILKINFMLSKGVDENT